MLKLSQITETENEIIMNEQGSTTVTKSEYRS